MDEQIGPSAEAAAVRMNGRRLWAAAAALLAGLAAACSHAPSQEWRAISLTARATPLYPDQPDERRLGELTFRGGLELTSDAPEFGGLSGMTVDRDGRLTAITDQGRWLEARLVRDPRTGDLTGLTGARMARLHDMRGQPLIARDDIDAEEVTRLPDGRLAVAFEQDHRILIYDLDRRGPGAPARPGPPVAMPPGVKPNDGLEALTALADGRMVALAEYPPGDGGAPFWIFPAGAADRIGPAGQTPREAGYGNSGMTRLPNGDLMGLERSWRPEVGVRINIRRMPAEGLNAVPPRLDGSVIAHIERPAAVDNFEAIAAVAGDSPGLVRLYLMSDDNFSDSQRTLLFAFDWRLPDGAPPGRSARRAD